MQEDFHYYATYCAAYIAGYSHEESLDIAYSAQFVDCCSRTLLDKINAPLSAATTQLQLEMMELSINPVTIQDVTRIWASFHFLPYDLYASYKRRPKLYMDKYRLICGPNGELVKRTVELAKNKSLQAAGVAMHVLADTWAHRYFAGTPSMVINNTNYHFYEVVDGEDRKVNFKHNPIAGDNIENSSYTNSLYQRREITIMNLGHGRAGHLPDYSFAVYKYLPSWKNYNEVIKDNPKEYYMAFCQMVYALRFLKGDYESFELDTYDYDLVKPYKERIDEILTKRQLNACRDWAIFGQELSGREIEAFDIEKYQKEYEQANKHSKDDTFIGKFIAAAKNQKSMVASEIYISGNLMAGFVIDANKKLLARIFKPRKKHS